MLDNILFLTTFFITRIGRPAVITLAFGVSLARRFDRTEAAEL